MAEDDAPDRSRRETHGVGRERRHGAGERRERRKEQLVEDERGGGTVKEEVVPLDGRADEAGGGDLQDFRAACQVAVARGDRGGHDASVNGGVGRRVSPKSWRTGAGVATEPEPKVPRLNRGWRVAARRVHWAGPPSR